MQASNQSCSGHAVGNTHTGKGAISGQMSSQASELVEAVLVQTSDPVDG